MKILFVASEAVPFASSGGLGDVIGSLPAAIDSELAKGENPHDVRVVIPMYQTTKARFAKELSLVCEFTVKLSWRNQYCGIYQIKKDHVTYYFIDNEYYFKRSSMYGSYDDGERFAFFSKAVLEMMHHLDFYPDVLHINDWQGALAIVYLKRKYAPFQKKYQNIKTIYTIHNIDYQGVFDFSILTDVFELDNDDRNMMDYNGCINLTKAAIVCTDVITTVSPRYAQEIQGEFFSRGLHHILRLYSSKLYGIINGIDIGYYNPETDPAIDNNYTAEDLSGKAKEKAALQKLCGLEQNPDIPVIAMVSRLASHKGFDLVRHVFDEMMKEKVQFVLLGTGEFELEDFFEEKQRQYPDKVCAKILYDKDLSKKIYAGADIFLMPSQSEPCGLAQMIASRYGTVPVVREVGGLYDTIKSYTRYGVRGNGFTFTNYNAHEMKTAVDEALKLYNGNRKAYNELVKRVMNVDFSWALSAKKYIEVYETLMGQE